MVENELKGFCSWEDASDLVHRIRLVKSPAELEYVREAGRLCDAALVALHDTIAPGVDESLLYSRMDSAILEQGGDYTRQVARSLRQVMVHCWSDTSAVDPGSVTMTRCSWSLALRRVTTMPQSCAPS